MKAYANQSPKLNIHYIVASSKDIYETINSGSSNYDVVMSSAMDLQIKLANDGLSETYNSLLTSSIPDWGVWQNKLYGFALEPIVIVISKEKFIETDEWDKLDIPSNRREFLSILRSNPERFKNNLITYDVNLSGAGYLFATQDERETDTFWRLSEVMGSLGTKLVCCSGVMLNALENNEVAAAYNVLGSYAEKRALNSKAIQIIYPEDYTHVLLRTALIPIKSKNKILAGYFLDYILSQEGQKIIEEKGGLPSINNKDIKQMLNAKPIRLDTGLLVYLDYLKRKNFLREWNATLLQ